MLVTRTEYRVKPTGTRDSTVGVVAGAQLLVCIVVAVVVFSGPSATIPLRPQGGTSMGFAAADKILGASSFFLRSGDEVWPCRGRKAKHFIQTPILQGSQAPNGEPLKAWPDRWAVAASNWPQGPVSGCEGRGSQSGVRTPTTPTMVPDMPRRSWAHLPSVPPAPLAQAWLSVASQQPRCG